MELLRQRQQGLGKQSNALGPDAHLASLGAEHLAVHTHDVADIVLLKLLIDRLIHLVLTGIELDTAVPVLQVAEADLAHAALAHQAAGHPDALAFHLVKVRLDLGGRGGAVKVRLLEGILPGSLQGGKLFPPDLTLLAQVHLGLLVCLFFSHVGSP